MPHFDVDEFCQNPSEHLSSIVYAKKRDLFSIAARCRLVHSSSAKKDDIRNSVLQYYVDNELVNEQEAKKFMVVVEKKSSDLEYLKLAIQLEQEKQKSEQEKQKCLDLEFNKKQIEFELETKAVLERKKQEIQLEQVRLEQEARIALQMEENKRKVAIESKRQEVTIEAQCSSFDLTKSIKLVPKFDEQEVDVFFRNFEDMASHMKWPLEQWVWLVKPKFIGKAATVVGSLVGELNYGVIKKAILDAYAVTSEGYRQQFRNFVKPHDKTWTEFACDKLRLFKKWLKSENITDFDKLVNLMVTEEFKRRLPQNIMMYISDKEESDLKKAAILADNYSLIHKVHSKGSPSHVKQHRTDQTGGSVGETVSPFCNYCKKQGHDISTCKNPHCKKSKEGNKFSASSQSKPQNEKEKKTSTLHCVSKDNELFEKFICEGTIFVSDSDSPVKVRILRDTGSTQSIILKSVFPSVKVLDENVIIKDLSSTVLLPLVEVNLDCPYSKGKVKLALRDEDFPLPDVQVILGNDLAGELLLPNLVICHNPIVENESCDKPEQLGLERGSKLEQISGLGYVNVVTRSTSNDEEDQTLLNLGEKLKMNKGNFVALQNEDRTLDDIRKQAVEKGTSKIPGYFFKDNVLFRLFRPLKLTNSDTWSEKQQLVIPLGLRKSLLEVAHNAFSHLGISKTYKRLSYDFFWPNMKQDVQDFVKKCHFCQIAGKPNEVIPKAPLLPIIVPHEPFQKVIIDCVGPLPKTRKGHQYLLTMMCPTTRYPIAIPVRNILAKTIVQHLLKVFTVYGFPKELQCDQGTNFKSNLFQSTLKEFNIHQSFSSAYHPESQGALERHHQTLKALLKKFCVETETDWDEDIDFLVSVIREVPNESIGVSPFEMMFGRKVRGPLQIVKDKLLSDNTVEEVTISQYLQRLKEHFESIHNFARNNLTKSQQEMKSRYDKNVKVRKFNVGDSVLAFFPIQGSPFKSKFSGPYVVDKCVNNHNYIIRTPDRRKDTQLIHVNLLKKYNAPSHTVLSCSRDTNVNNSKCKDNTNFQDLNEENEIPSWNNCTNQTILASLPQYLQQLDESQQKDLMDLLHLYEDICSDVPQECKCIAHVVELVPGTRPIRQQFYRLSEEKRKLMKQEVEYLLKNGLAKPSKSPWASPCVLVPKPGNKVRLCTDYRKLNSVTIKDSFPLPRITDILDSIGNAAFLTQIDMLKGYYQIPLTDTAKIMSAFITPFGLFQYERLPFGMSNAPATFQRMVNHLTQDLDGVYAYLDDIVVIASTWQEHMIRLRALFSKLREMGLTINLSKSTFAKAQVRYLGHVIGSGEIIPKSANLKAIMDFPTPSTRKEVMRFLGMSSYYRRFCKNFSSVAHPLTNLTSPKTKFIWDKSCENSFQQIKNMLCSKPVLSAPDPSKPFILQVDACDYGVGAVLLQEKPETGLLHPVCYKSRRESVYIYYLE